MPAAFRSITSRRRRSCSARSAKSSVATVWPATDAWVVIDYRIDHYLGKETVQNLMALRFANALFEPLWNAAHIDHVQITVAEAIGVEGRGAYYGGSGAPQDMVQNHRLQLLCLIAMEPPNSLEADAVRDEKLKVLKSLARIDDSNVAALTVLGNADLSVVPLDFRAQTGPSESVASLDRGPRLEDHVTLSELGRIDELSRKGTSRCGSFECVITYWRQ
jgi:Glucose-6-phosphate dehydrogenase, C-terminal domain/Glucose-6-phosphate dehydrogenase, NAD binding domain